MPVPVPVLVPVLVLVLVLVLELEPEPVGKDCYHRHKPKEPAKQTAWRAWRIDEVSCLIS